MATSEAKEVRKVSVNISVRVNSMTQTQAQELEDRIRDVCDDYEGVDVQTVRGQERSAVR